MKIVQINTFSYKAAGNIMMNLHNYMLQNGIDSYVAWGRGKNAENNHEYFMNDDIGVKIHGAYTRVTDKTGFASILSTKKLIKWLDEINPDIIHLHCILGYYINIKILFDYIIEKKIKVIWTQHDCWAFTGHCAYFDAVGCEKWKFGCFKCEQLKTYPASKLLDSSKWNWHKKNEIFNLANMTIVTPCKWLADIIGESFLKKFPRKVIYNGINTAVFRPSNGNYIRKKYNIEDKNIILGVAGEWTERKGLRDFIKLNKIMDKKSFKIIVVGVNDKQKTILPNDIISIGRTENVKELVDLYSESYVYFNPTYEDNFPTTNLEALACGTPVITYKTGGSVEAIGNNGYIVEQGDVFSVKKYIEEEINFKNVQIENRYCMQSMIDQYLLLYKEIKSNENKKNCQ